MLRTIIQSPNYKWWAFAAISIGTFTSVVDQISVSIALPTIAEHFRADLPTIQWVVVGYTLTVCALLLPMGRLADIVGRKQVYITGFAIFVLGAALAGFSPNVTSLILAKAFQGVGAAMTQGTGMAMVTSIFPASERGRALGMQMSVVGVGAVAGPVLGGLLVSALHWRAVFFFSVPAGLLSIAALALVVDKRLLLQDREQPHFDWLGAALSAGALVTFLLAMTLGVRSGWGSAPIIAAILSFAVLLVGFIWWELRTVAPMLELRLFKRPNFSLGIAAGFLSFFGTFSLFFLMPFYLQQVLGYSAGQVGLLLVPTAIAMIVMGPLSGRLSDRYGPRIFKVSGMALSVTGLLILSRVTETFPLGLIVVGMVLQGCGMGMFGSPNSSSILGSVEPTRYGVVGALLSLIRNAASVASIAVGTAIVTGIMASKGYPPSLTAVSDVSDAGLLAAFVLGLRITFLVMGGVLVVGVVLSALQGSRRTTEVPVDRIEEPQAGGSPPD